MRGILLLCCLLGASLLVDADQATNTPPMSHELPHNSTQVTPEGCTIDEFTVHSPSMGREIKVAVVLPPEYKDQPEKQYPILYTLHGSGAPYDSFSKMGPLRAALKDKPMIVTCFDGDSDSMYLDSPYPQKAGRDPKDTTPVRSLFTTFFLNEFIPAIDKLYRVNPAQRMLTGFSMGGYGAFHYMLAKPGEFASVSSMSGWFDSWLTLDPESQKWLTPLLGPFAQFNNRYADADLYAQFKKQVAAGVKFPPIYLTCGTEDHLIQGNRKMNAFLFEKGIAHEYRESPGIHNWAFWKGASAGIIDFHWRALRPQ